MEEVFDENDRQIIHNVIFNELCRGKIERNSRDEYIRIIDELAENGAEGVILGCTEIGMLIKQRDVQVELFDTTAIHAAKAVQMALD